MTIARSGLKVRVKVVGQANAVGPTSIEGSFFLVYLFAQKLQQWKQLHHKVMRQSRTTRFSE